MLSDDVVGKTLQQLVLTATRVNLKVSKPLKRPRDAANHRTLLGLRVAVVKHIADDNVACGNEAQRTRGGYAEEVHSLAAEKLAYRGAKHCPAISRAGVRRGPRPLQLQLPALPERGQLTQGDSPSVTELACPVTKLLTAIAGSIGAHGGSQPGAGEDFNCGLRRA